MLSLPILRPATIATFTPFLAAAKPCFLPRGSLTVPALTTWFTPSTPDSTGGLDVSFFEKTLTPEQLSSLVTIESSTATSFSRSQLPFALFLQYLSADSPPPGLPHLYLAQSPLLENFPQLKASLPTPELVQAGRGDIYATNLWLGYSRGLVTPIHRDPNGNLFLQMRGRKVVRLWGPEVWTEGEMGGRLLREDGMVAKREIGWGPGSESSGIERGGHEVEVKEGEGLFIPTGWWHTVKGVGEGLSASVNWWFR